MTDTAGTQEAVELEADGVTVRKTLVTDEFPVPTIRLELESNHDRPTTIRLREIVPEGFSMDSIGFHPDYESENWTAYQDRRIEFVRELDPGETAVTIYGIRADDESGLEGFMVEPEIVEVDGAGLGGPAEDIGGPEPDEPDVADAPADDEPGEAVRDIVDPDRGEALREMLAEEGEATHGAPEEAQPEPAAPEAEAEPTSEEEPTPEPAPSQPEPEPAPAEEEPAPTQPEPAPPEPEPIHEEAEAAEPEPVSRSEPEPTQPEPEPTAEPERAPPSEPEPTQPEPAPAAEPEPAPTPSAETVVEGSISAALAEELREGEFDQADREFIREELGLDISASTEAQLRHLQTRVEDVLGYANDLADLINQGGVERLEEIEDEIETMREATSANADDLETLRNDVIDDRHTVNELEDSIGDLAANTANASSDAADAKAAVEGLRSDVDRLEDRLEGLQRSMDGLQESLDEVIAWRNQLGQLFGGGGGDDS